jgi:hypothetical protein
MGERMKLVHIKPSVAVCLGLFVLGGSLAILQLWGPIVSAGLFVKIELTLLLVFGLVLVVSFVMNEARQDKANRQGTRLD